MKAFGILFWIVGLACLYKSVTLLFEFSEILGWCIVSYLGYKLCIWLGSLIFGLDD